MHQLEVTLNGYHPISLEEMDDVALLKRQDTKFIFHYDMLNDILDEVRSFYRILEIDGIRVHEYQSYYYDTYDLQNYFQHHNKKLGRLKVRKRSYIDSGITFLEAKYKTQKGQTSKKRLKIKALDEEINQNESAFLQKHMDDENLTLTLKNYFKRFTLVHNSRKERITVDLFLSVMKEEAQIDFENLVILEIKQEKENRNSELFKSLKEKGIRSSGMSKYCICLSFLDPDLKSNNFKPNLIKIEKILADG
jgi:hypothetical protein